MVHTFRNGMPLKRHWRHIKVYDNCFTGVEAVAWLHSALQRNPHICPGITRDQVVQLLNKFLKGGVFENVNISIPTGHHQFKENGDLYQFCSRLLPDGSLRVPLSTTSSNFPQIYRFNEPDQSTRNKGHKVNPSVWWGLEGRNSIQTKSEYFLGKECNADVNFRRKNSLKSNQAQDRENISLKKNQIQSIKSVPKISLQRKYTGPEVHQEQHLTGYGQSQSIYPPTTQSEPDCIYSPARHNPRNDGSMHLENFFAQRDYGAGQQRIGNIDKNNQSTVQHGSFKSFQLGNQYSQPKKNYSNLKLCTNSQYNLDCKQSQNLSNSFQSSASVAALNVLGIPQLHISQHDRCDKLHPLPKRDSFLKTSPEVGCNQNFPQIEYNIQPKNGKHMEHLSTSVSQIKKLAFISQNVQDSRFNGHQYFHSTTVGNCRVAVDEDYISTQASNLKKEYSCNEEGTTQYTQTNSSSVSPKFDHFVVKGTSGTEICNSTYAKCKQTTRPVSDSCKISPQTPHSTCIAVPEEATRNVEVIWKTLVISRLQELLVGIEDVPSLLPDNLPAGWVVANGTQKEPIMTHLSQQCVSLIKHLQHCHQEYTKETICAVKDYFCNLSEPLTTFQLYTILTQAFQYVEYVNNIHTHQAQVFEGIPSSQSIENIVLNIASPPSSCSKQLGKNKYFSDGGCLVSGSMLLSTVLPPNSCFETAFTSDSPVTRIVPQRNMDTLHFSRKVMTSMSARSSKTMGTYSHDSRVRQPSSHVVRPSSITKKSLGTANSFLKRNASAPNLLDDLAPGSNPCSLQGSQRLQVSVKFNSRAHMKRAAIKEKGGQKASQNARKSKEPSPEERRLQHCRNKSGGYVNPALSQSLDDCEGEYDLALQELDYAAALESLHKLMQYSRNTTEGTSCTDNYENTSSESGSYYTAVSSSASSSCSSQVLIDSLDSSINTCGGDQWTQHGENLGVAVLQLLLLLIPPVNRLQLRNLLSFLKHMCLFETGGSPFMRDMSDAEFPYVRSILCCRNEADYDVSLAFRFVTFLVTHYESIMKVPANLTDQVYCQTTQMQQQLTQAHITYCEQVSCQQFEQQRLTGSQLALSELLEQILADRKMGHKEKKKRMKMFKESYPHIYQRRFPDSSKHDKTAEEKPRGFLHLATFNRLRSLRV